MVWILVTSCENPLKVFDLGKTAIFKNLRKHSLWLQGGWDLIKEIKSLKRNGTKRIWLQQQPFNPLIWLQNRIASVVPSSAPRPDRVNSQLVSLLSVGTLIMDALFAMVVYLLTVSSSSTTVLNTISLLLQLLFLFLLGSGIRLL